MAVTPTKTWEYSTDHSMTGSSLTDRNRKMWIRLKEMLTDTGAPGYLDAAGGVLANPTAPWIVQASSDSVTADGTDRWVDETDIVGSAAGGAHSWIHLRQVDYFGGGDHLDMLLSVEDLSTCVLGYVAFARGATPYNADGTTTNRPTVGGAATEVIARDGLTPSGSADASDQMWGNDSVNDTRVMQFRMSDDGQCGGWWVFDAGACVAFAGWQADEGGLSPARVNPFWAWYGSTDATVEMSTWVSNWNSLAFLRSLDDSDIPFSANAGCHAFTSTEVVLTTLNDGGDGTRFFGQILIGHLAANTIHGVLTDQWWGSENNASGEGAPTTPPIVWRAIGDMIIPWPSGTAMLVS